MIRDFFRKKVVQPIIDLIKQGLSPEKLAMSLALGTVVCCFPIIGLTTILCVFFTQIFRLNHVASQIANYFAYPLQLILIVPFLHMGNRIFGVKPMHFDLAQMLSFFKTDTLGFLKTYGAAGARACVAWLIFAPIAMLVIYFPLRLIMRLLQLKFSPRVSD